jgi:hypothetical protein
VRVYGRRPRCPDRDSGWLGACVSRTGGSSWGWSVC